MLLTGRGETTARASRRLLACLLPCLALLTTDRPII